MSRKLVAAVLLAGCASTSRPVPKAWMSLPKAASAGDYCAHFECAANLRLANILVSNDQLFRGTKALTPRFVAIDSFDLSLERKEIVFSAKRNNNFDVGLVSMDGSDIHWIPEDPADETNVRWAPRGNKVSYIVHTANGSLVRTVHIPTATPVSIDFPDTQIDGLSWEPKGERFALVLESPESSQHAVSMTYAGEKREEIKAASDRLDVEIEPIGGALIMRPKSIRYNERLPLVVWFDDKPFAWSNARAALMRNARVAIAIAPKVSGNFWSEIRKVQWIDPSRTYVVGGGPAEQGGNAAIVIKADGSGHRYVRRGNTISVSPAVVQSFAAAYIADDLKGTPPPNGRR